jgi:uncharacterized protein YyaL (SSP411 family)
MPALNRLAQETSLYLRQHAGNPVHWQPWDAGALRRAQEENKPIFLSIGYSACHWCHVMEHESFEDAEIANILNEHFVSIKVDREERPDLDGIYMAAVVALTGQGGWPMSVFLTPELQPFYAGTYFPPRDRGGMPGFGRVLEAIHQAWTTRREELVQQAGHITAALAEQTRLETSGALTLDEKLLQRAGQVLSRSYDARFGGFGGAPKFPHPFDLRLLLRIAQRFGADDAQRMVLHTLDRMARGGIYDQLGGGFHRYSTDERWLVPHFEKMLYDNALLVPVYLEAYQITQNPFYRRIAIETLEWAQREMTSPSGGFYSTTDADSEGEEGKYFVWTEEEIKEVLGDEAEFALEVFAVDPIGNWEGRTILTRPKTDAQEAALRRIPEEAFLQRLTAIKTRLLAARERRIKPNRDEKILTAWNGLMIAAQARASLVLGEPTYAQRGAAAADFILNRMRQPDGRLYRTSLETGPAKLNAYLEDYAFFIDGLVHLYEATFEDRWLQAAGDLAEVMIDQFWDEAQGGFYYVGQNHEKLILREKQSQDNSVPSGNSMAVTALLHLSRLTGRTDYGEKVERTLNLFADQLARHSPAYGQMLIALDDYLGPVEEFALFGAPEELREMRAMLNARYRPRKVLAGGDSVATLVPLLQQRKAIDGKATVYRCINQTCEKPWVGLENIRASLAETLS